MNGTSGSTEDVYRQRLDDAYYLRRIRDILQDVNQPRSMFPCEMTQLNDYLFIGNQKNAEDLDELVNQGITHVINCAPSKRRASCGESPYPLETGIIGFKAIPAEDKEDYEICKHFDETFIYLERVKQVKGKALVHCNMGVNRSGAIAAAYLMVSQCRYLFDVISFLKDKRKIILTNKGFRRQLIKYASMKRLLDPISSDYYARRSNNFERLPIMDYQHAFSTPQLKRCPLDQKPPRSRDRSGRSSAITTEPHHQTVADRDFVVRSLPRNMTRSRNDLDQQWPESFVSSNPNTRRSISYIVWEKDNKDDDSDRCSRSRNHQIRKSIAVDHIVLPISHNSSEAGRRHDDIPRLETKPCQFSSRLNLTISSPSDSISWRGNKKSPSLNNHQTLQTPRSPSAPESLTSPVNNPEPQSRFGSGIRNRYCRQIRQHFSELISLIRPNLTRSVASSTPNSNQLTFTLPLQRSEARTIPLPRGLSNSSSQCRRDGSGKSGAQTPTNRDYQHAFSTPSHSLPFQFSSTHGSVDALNSKPNFEARPFQLFSSELNHIVRRRNQPTAEQLNQTSKGSLVLIGTRTTTLHPQASPQSHATNQSTNMNCEVLATPRRERRRIRPKTDSELL